MEKSDVGVGEGSRIGSVAFVRGRLSRVASVEAPDLGTGETSRGASRVPRAHLQGSQQRRGLHGVARVVRLLQRIERLLRRRDVRHRARAEVARSAVMTFKRNGQS